MLRYYFKFLTGPFVSLTVDIISLIPDLLYGGVLYYLFLILNTISIIRRIRIRN